VKQKAQALVEFALVFPLLFFILTLTIDLYRVNWATTTVAEAARQGARQAVANTEPYDNAFGASAGSCSGLVLTPSASGNGCLKSSRIYETVLSNMGGFNRGATTLTEASPSNCPSPAVGQVSVCVYPTEAGAAGTYASCAAARTSLGRDPVAGDLGSRIAEKANPQYVGCFPIAVTVIYRYDTLVPFLGTAAPSWLKLQATTTMLAEY
jgi:Flp pilus assembly protein TadG